MSLRRLIGAIAAGAVVLAPRAEALTLDLIEGTDAPTVELPAALLPSGSGISIIPASAVFVGRIGTAGLPDTAQSATFAGLDLTPASGGGPAISLSAGILLTNGVGNVPESNSYQAFDDERVGQSAPGTGNDPDIDALLPAGSTTFDANSIQFDFTVDPGFVSVTARFVFGTDEYPDQLVTDIFAFIVDDVNYAFFTDGSLVRFVVPVDANRFNDNDFGSNVYALEYDGLSHVLDVVGVLDPNRSVHTVKIAIADTGDTIFDSGVFVEGLRASKDPKGGIKDPLRCPSTGVVLDFEALEVDDANIHDHGTVLTTEGFVLDSGNVTHPIETFGRQRAEYNGSTAITTYPNDGILYLHKQDDGPFSLCSMAMSETHGWTGPLAYTLAYTLDGLHPGAEQLEVEGAVDVTVLGLPVAANPGWEAVQWDDFCICLPGDCVCDVQVSEASNGTFCVQGAWAGGTAYWQLNSSGEVPVGPPELQPGSTAEQITLALANSIENSGIADAALNSDPRCFDVSYTPGFTFNVHTAGSAPCEVTGNPNGCAFNPLLIEQRYLRVGGPAIPAPSGTRWGAVLLLVSLTLSGGLLAGLQSARWRR